MLNKAILCVDDETIVLETLIEQLEKRLAGDYIYETAETAEEGFEVVKELVAEHIDVLIIVSDWLMPGMKGDEFLVKIHEKFPGIVTVMLTGQADEEAIQRAQKHANLHACVLKPWVEDELIQTIKSGLNLL